MLRKIELSAIIPVYNREKTIGRAIDSVLSQAYPLSELIIIDDGSTDNTRKQIEHFGKDVRYVYQKNKGVSHARGRGVREARYEWVAFLDSDDYWARNHIKRIVEGIRATEGKANLYFADAWDKEKKLRHRKDCGFQIKAPFELRANAAEWALMPKQPMLIPATVIRRTIFTEIGGFPENMRTREDTLLFYFLCLYGPACAVRGCGGVVTSDADDRLTQLYDGKSLTFWENTIFLYYKLLNYSIPLDKKYRKHLKNSLSSSFFSIARTNFLKNKILRSVENLWYSYRASPFCFIKEFSVSILRNIFRK